MSRAAPEGARRWLGEEMERWAAWVRHEDNVAVSPYPSLVGWLIGGAILSEEQAARINEALGYRRADAGVASACDVADPPAQLTVGPGDIEPNPL